MKKKIGCFAIGLLAIILVAFAFVRFTGNPPERLADDRETETFFADLASKTVTYANGDVLYEQDEDELVEDTDEHITYYRNMVIAFTDHDFTDSEKSALEEVTGGVVVGDMSGIMNMLQIRLDAPDLESLRNASTLLEQQEGVLYASFDTYEEVTIQAEEMTDPWDATKTPIEDRGNEGNPNGNDWWAEAIGTYTAWEYSDYAKPSYRVGVVDGGFDLYHEEFRVGSEELGYTYKINMLRGHENSGLDALSDGDNLTEEESKILQYSSHGTHVSGIIAAEHNDIGLRGIADGAEIVCDTFVGKTTSATLATIKQMVESGVKVINNSYGDLGTDDSPGQFKENLRKEALKKRNAAAETDSEAAESEYQDELSRIDSLTYEEFLEEHYNICKADTMTMLMGLIEIHKKAPDFLLVVSAGNYSGPAQYGDNYARQTEELFNELRDSNPNIRQYLDVGGLTYQSIKDHIIVVGAVENSRDRDGNYAMTEFSAYGDRVDICAPGKDIFSTAVGYGDYGTGEKFYNGYVRDSGTSMAAPMVTGAAAYVWALNPAYTYNEVKELLISTAQVQATGVGSDEGNWYPMLNVGAAVQKMDEEGLIDKSAEEVQEAEDLDRMAAAALIAAMVDVINSQGLIIDGYLNYTTIDSSQIERCELVKRLADFHSRFTKLDEYCVTQGDKKVVAFSTLGFDDLLKDAIGATVNREAWEAWCEENGLGSASSAIEVTDLIENPYLYPEIKLELVRVNSQGIIEIAATATHRGVSGNVIGCQDVSAEMEWLGYEGLTGNAALKRVLVGSIYMPEEKDTETTVTPWPESDEATSSDDESETAETFSQELRLEDCLGEPWDAFREQLTDISLIEEEEGYLAIYSAFLSEDEIQEGQYTLSIEVDDDTQKVSRIYSESSLTTLYSIRLGTDKKNAIEALKGKGFAITEEVSSDTETHMYNVETGISVMLQAHAFDENNVLIDDYPYITMLGVMIDISKLTGSGEEEDASFDQSTGETLLNLKFESDFSELNGNEADAYGDYRFGEGVEGQAAYFDGDGDYLSLGTGLNLIGDFTLNVWVKSESADRSDAALLAKYQTNYYGPYDFYLSYNRPAFWATSSDGDYEELVANTAVGEDQWHMITYTYDKAASLLRIYIDGVLDSEFPCPAVNINDDEVTIGRQSLMFEPYSRLEYKGWMDEMQLYESCINAEQVTNLYNSYTPVEEEPTITFDATIIDTKEYNGHRYDIYYTDSMDWGEVYKWSYNQGMYLAVINDRSEDEFLYDFINENGITSAYFGLADPENNGNYVWVNGDTVTYANWASGEPNGQGGYEHYGMYYSKYSDGTWNDGSGEPEFYFLTECDQ